MNPDTLYLWLILWELGAVIGMVHMIGYGKSSVIGASILSHVIAPFYLLAVLVCGLWAVLSLVGSSRT